MTTFDNREQVFEKKFAQNEKLGFKVEARCCKIFGRWVAEQLGLSGADADAYAMTVVEANLEEPGFDDVYRKVSGDFDAKGIEISDEIFYAELGKALETAKEQVAAES